MPQMEEETDVTL